MQRTEAKAILNELKTFASQHTPSYATVKLWFRKFRGGYQDLKDKHRSGCLIIKTSVINIDTIRDLIEEDHYLIYIEIEALTSLSRGTMHTIIHEYLRLRKITSRWVTHDLSQKNKNDRI